MMRSMLADQPYSPVTRTHGESARRLETTTLSTLSARTSFISLHKPSDAAFACKNQMLETNVSSLLANYKSSVLQAEPQQEQGYQE